MTMAAAAEASEYIRSEKGNIAKRVRHQGVEHIFMSINREDLALIAEHGGAYHCTLPVRFSGRTYEYLLVSTDRRILNDYKRVYASLPEHVRDSTAAMGLDFDCRRALYEGRLLRAVFPIDNRSFLCPPPGHPRLILVYAENEEEFEKGIKRYRDLGGFARPLANDDFELF